MNSKYLHLHGWLQYLEYLTGFQVFIKINGNDIIKWGCCDRNQRPPTLLSQVFPLNGQHPQRGPDRCPPYRHVICFMLGQNTIMESSNLPTIHLPEVSPHPTIGCLRCIHMETLKEKTTPSSQKKGSAK